MSAYGAQIRCATPWMCMRWAISPCSALRQRGMGQGREEGSPFGTSQDFLLAAKPQGLGFSRFSEFFPSMFLNGRFKSANAMFWRIFSACFQTYSTVFGNFPAHEQQRMLWARVKYHAGPQKKVNGLRSHRSFAHGSIFSVAQWIYYNQHLFLMDTKTATQSKKNACHAHAKNCCETRKSSHQNIKP